MPRSAVLGDRLDKFEDVGGLPVMARLGSLPRFADDLAGLAVALAVVLHGVLLGNKKRLGHAVLSHLAG